MKTIYPSTGVSARARHQRHGSQMPTHSSNFSVQLSLVLALSAYSVHAWAQESGAPDVVTSAARTSQVVTDALNSTTLITRADIESATVTDLAGLLRQQSGVIVRQNGPTGNLSQVSLRGGDTKQTLILVDGVPLNNLSFGSATLEQIPLSLIDRVEIVRGNVSALYGSQATGGLVQIFTRKAQMGQQAEVRFAIGSHGQKQASAQVSTGNDKVQLSAGLAHEQAKAVSARNAAVANPDKDGYRNNSGNLSVRFTPNERNEFGVKFYQTNGYNDYDELFGGTSAIHYQKAKTEQLTAYSNNQLMSNWSSQLILSQGVTDAENTSISSFAPFVTNDKTTTQSISWQNQIDLNVGKLIAGVSHTHQTIKNGNTYTVNNFSKNKRDTNSIWLGYNLDQNRHHLQLNGRWDKLSDFGHYETGAINYGYDVTPELKVFAGYSNGFTAPSFWDLYGSSWASNKNLKVEKAQYAQAGVQYDRQKYGTRVTLYHNKYKNRIYLDSAYIPQNADSRAKGVEWHSWYADRGWNVDFGLTYQDVQFAQTKERWLRQPRVLANVSLGKTWKQWQAQADWTVQGNMKDVSNKTVAGFGVLNTSLFYSPRKDLKLGLTVGNVVDRKYEPIAGYNAMPRNFLFSVNYKPQW